MRKIPAPALRAIRPSLVEIGRRLKANLPPEEHENYHAFLSHLGRDDVVSACNFGETRSDPKLWIGSDPSVYRNVRQAYLFSSKVTRKGDSGARERAWQKFLDCEAKCRRTNKRFAYLLRHPERTRSLSKNCISYFDISEIRKLVASYLGSFWLAYPEMVKRVGFGPGMTMSSVDVHKTSVPYKLRDGVSITEAAIPVWKDFLLYGGLHPEWIDLSVRDAGLVVNPRVRVTRGCKITFVPKTSVIERTIAIEPSANGMMQLAVHRHLLPRLKRFGLDLADQQRNRNQALRGSSDGSLATIDLSSASDLISTEVVRALLPREWFDFLSAIRSPSGRYGNHEVAFEKFSSMGNGFTFILESIIFYAIAMVICNKSSDVTVYGDDIIVPSQFYNRLVSVLSFFGFKVNTKKSYAEGPFRESCGLDAFGGVDVRPVFVRGESLSLMQVIAFHNHCFRRGLFSICQYLEELVPRPHRLFGPPGPDAGFFFTEDPEKLQLRRKYDKATFSYIYPCYAEKGVRSRFSSRLLLESSLFDGGLYSSGAPLRSVTKLVTIAAHRDY